jgi:hypothetical protein
MLREIKFLPIFIIDHMIKNDQILITLVYAHVYRIFILKDRSVREKMVSVMY